MSSPSSSSTAKKVKVTDSMDPYIGSDGPLTSDPPPRQDHKPHYPVARQIDKTLSKHFSKRTAVLHIDGAPSVQKACERGRRETALKRTLSKLSSDISQIIGTKKKPKSMQYKKLKQAYRPPSSAWTEIMEELRRHGWNVHVCPHQADSHIGQSFSDPSTTDDAVVVTGDSDLIAYEGVRTVVMPVGRSYELTVFTKSDLLSSLDLPSERHLLVAAITTKNDYLDGIKWVGIKRNIDIIRDMDLDMKPGTSVQTITDAISLYLKQIKDIGHTTISDYQDAITVFAKCYEDGSNNAGSAIESYVEVSKLLKILEDHRVECRRLTSQKRIMTDLPSTQPTITEVGEPRNRWGRRGYQDKLRREKLESWKRASFKSPNFDKPPRYTAHVVEDITKACPVDKGIIKTLSVSEPRRQKPKESQGQKEPENVQQGEPQEPKDPGIDPENHPKEDLKKESKKKGPKKETKKKEVKKKENKKETAKPTTGPAKGECKALKDLFAEAFKRVTLTLGCLTGALRRATSLNQNEALQVAEQINKAVHILSTARILVFKGIEIFVYRHASKDQAANVADLDMDPSKSSTAMEIDDSSCGSGSGMDPLDLLLDKKHGRTLLRNLGALVMSGTTGNRTSTDPLAQQARALAKSIYDDLKLAMPN
ncbi:hypothetical protein BGZ65_009213, partial [Modicella reniformis]